MSNDRTGFETLTWDNLAAWAGSAVVKRGKSYIHRVEDMRRAEDGSLLAWVEGSDRYATQVRRSPDGALYSVCTCPYAAACKHAVATILAYLEERKAGRDVPQAESDDERLTQLAGEDGWNDDLNDDLDGNLDDETPTNGRTGATGAEKAPPAATAPTPSRTEDYLANLSREALFALLRELCNVIPQARQRVLEKAELADADVGKLVKSARAAIRTAASKPGWRRHWSNESFLPDYRPVRERLQMLLRTGCSDEVLTLGDDLLRLGLDQIGMSDDEGETGHEVASCMEIVFQALRTCSKTDAERLLWEDAVRRREDFGVFDGIDSLWKPADRFPASVWAEVADGLTRELGPVPAQAPKEAGSSPRYQRSRLLAKLRIALERAGRAGEVTAVLEREVAFTQDYPELVDHLLALGRGQDAARWCHDGIVALDGTLPGIGSALRDRLRSMAVSDGDWPRVAAFDADVFFDGPCVESYQKLQEAAMCVGRWHEVRTAILRWLETGCRPDMAVPTPARPRGKRRSAEPAAEPSPPWPLPRIELPREAGGSGYREHFPRLQLLIDLALHEHRHDDALALYDRMAPAGRSEYDFGLSFFHDNMAQRVANAVCDTHPSRAVELWRRRVEQCVSTTDQSAYALAGDLLSKMKPPMDHLGRLAEWKALIAGIRAAQRRKRCLMQVLDEVEGTTKPSTPQRILE